MKHHITIVKLIVNNQICYAIKSLRRSRNVGKNKNMGKYFFTAYSTKEKAQEVATRIESTYKPLDESVNLIWDEPGKII